MLSKDEIIESVARSKWLRDICQNIGGHLADDLQQEVLLALCEKQEQELQAIVSLQFYCIRIAVRLHDGNGKQKFYRYFRRVSESLPDHVIDDSEPYTEDEHNARLSAAKVTQREFDRIAQQHERAGWYVRILWQEYCKYHNMAEIHKKSGIPRREISKMINAVKDTIKKRYERISN